MSGLDSPLGVIGDLPTHTLVVHYAVVMLPLAALALVAIILVPRWRGAFVWAAMVGLVIGTAAAFLSKVSGEQLANRIGEPQQHALWGDLLPWAAVLLLIVAGAWLWMERRSAKRAEDSGDRSGDGVQRVLAVIAIVLAVVVSGMTVVVGHTGAAAVWESRNLNGAAADAENESDDAENESEDEADDSTPVATSPSTPSQSSSASSSAAPSPSGPAAITLEEVAAHASAEDCWSAVNDNVYDLTDWIPEHPGGGGVVEGMCGVDGTASYDSQHKGSTSAEEALVPFEIGPLG